MVEEVSEGGLRGKKRRRKKKWWKRSVRGGLRGKKEKEKWWMNLVRVRIEGERKKKNKIKRKEFGGRGLNIGE